MGYLRPLTSVIIPLYNHAAHIADAVQSVREQTFSTEIVVVDDGSVDDGAAIANAAIGPHYGRVIQLPSNHGPCAARNRGLEEAIGDYVMFLDADDVLAPEKLEFQIKALEAHPECGWCLCDTLIRDEVKGRSMLASEQYGYKALDLGGWVFPQLQQGNFIPIMAPLIRREVLDGIRFDSTKVPEDWFFWMDVARAARLCTIDYCGAIYEHRRTGRSRIPKAARRGLPHIVQPLRLNLGCGTPNTRSWHPIPGLVNLDKSLGWRFEDGLGEFADESVAGATISHSAMYIPIERWAYAFSEIYRVLRPGGVVRVTEDSTMDPKSSRFGGWKGSEPAITLTYPELFAMTFGMLGMEVKVVGPDETYFEDKSLIQHQHGEPPDVFFIEAIKPI